MYVVISKFHMWLIGFDCCMHNILLYVVSVCHNSSKRDMSQLPCC
jgi:hypothetical protein